jgi:hypothetical protein
MNQPPRKKWKSNVIFLIVLWIILLLASLTVLSSVVTTFIRSLQTQSATSLNWAGYVVTSNLLFRQSSVKGVNASWIVPKVAVSVRDTYSSAWIGIGGRSEETLIQVGTEHDSRNGQEWYSVWYEMLPNNSITISEVKVAPGDKIAASITLANSSANRWLIEIENLSTGQCYGCTSQNFTYNSSRLTAEWIVERPKVNNLTSTLADFGNITFTGAIAQVGTTIGTITKFPNYELAMTNSQNINLVTLSSISEDGSSFTVTYLG